ncbi:MAG: hypothetical protein NTZ09_19170 [Candidatus Hydrogenedentes bacterium]|nr:hypothetical protein [Candidatus Hydrogenedentota bacterium]
MTTAQAQTGMSIISPGCRTSKVKIAKLYLGIPKALWPTPAMDLDEERKRYEAEFDKRAKEFADCEFSVNELLTKPEDVAPIKDRLAEVDGILAIHLSMGVSGILTNILACGKPVMLIAAPYSGHEWTSFGGLVQNPEKGMIECILSSDFNQLAVAVRPFRAIHHLHEARIVNISSRQPKPEFLQAIKDKFGTQVITVDKDHTMAAYNAVPDDAARQEAKKWISEAQKVVEPNEDEIFRSCKLALAFEILMNEQNASVITTDCYGTMYHELPAFPCIGNVRLNDMGLGGICESDLQSAMTHIILQGLTGKPGFISDPTVDEAAGGIILAHCLGSTKMDGPDGERCPYRLRTIMERQEGAVPQVFMRKNQRVTQALLVGADLMPYFTGEIIDAPDSDRGCRTQITVKVDGSLEALWKNWKHTLHRVTVYGDAKKDLERFCKFKAVKLYDEAAATA